MMRLKAFILLLLMFRVAITTGLCGMNEGQSCCDDTGVLVEYCIDQDIQDDQESKSDHSSSTCQCLCCHITLDVPVLESSKNFYTIPQNELHAFLLPIDEEDVMPLWHPPREIHAS